MLYRILVYLDLDHKKQPVLLSWIQNTDLCKSLIWVQLTHDQRTMWIFTLFMMVLTRTRSDEDSRVPITESVAEGSASATTTRTTRRHKHGSADTRVADKVFMKFVDERLRAQWIRTRCVLNRYSFYEVCG
ncbi:hypothetical protein L1987_29937 [Smallanthus sonchifolius]|uniref:Uncharacterized protein n=1 Tax=Smallanthus sonchifolius TaxID=185202 RepID=A0ACB9I2V8_9ASTR|nr:hypothetical protein L1987_29937 [Smallanthus sonchifolius]